MRVEDLSFVVLRFLYVRARAEAVMVEVCTWNWVEMEVVWRGIGKAGFGFGANGGLRCWARVGLVECLGLRK